MSGEEEPRILRGKLRLILPVFIVLFLKLLAAVFIYHRLSILGGFHTPWMETWGQGGPARSWLYLFSAQDTGFYVALAAGWYAYPMYVFFPAYPVICKIVGAVIGDFWLSAFLVSFIFGLASLPLFQLVAENYMSRSEAAASTTLIALFPYVFLFTTVSYSESLFLFSTLATWYLYIRGRLVPSILSATLAALTRPYGVAIIVPVAIGLLAGRKFKQSSLCAVPVCALLGWMYYLYSKTGDLFVFSTQQSYWMRMGVEFGWIQRYIMPLISFNVWKYPKFDYLLVAFIIFVGYLVFCTVRVDAKLGVYSLLLFLALLYFGNFISLPRFFAFIFPIWLVVRIKNVPLLMVGIAFFLLNSLLVWYQFILGVWVA
jgi:Gpi18-like mannosyltransferase